MTITDCNPHPAPAEGGAGSVGLGRWMRPRSGMPRAGFPRAYAHLHGRIPASGARPRAEEGSLRDLTPQTRKGIGVYAPMIGSTVASPPPGAPPPRSAAPPP